MYLPGSISIANDTIRELRHLQKQGPANVDKVRTAWIGMMHEYITSITHMFRLWATLPLLHQLFLLLLLTYSPLLTSRSNVATH